MYIYYLGSSSLCCFLPFTFFMTRGAPQCSYVRICVETFPQLLSFCGCDSTAGRGRGQLQVGIHWTSEGSDVAFQFLQKDFRNLRIFFFAMWNSDLAKHESHICLIQVHFREVTEFCLKTLECLCLFISVGRKMLNMKKKKGLTALQSQISGSY